MNTHKFNGIDQLNGEVHPLKDVECELVEIIGMTMAGYDCTVWVNLEEWKNAYAKSWVGRGMDRNMESALKSADQLLRDMDNPVDGRVLAEANYGEELEAI